MGTVFACPGPLFDPFGAISVRLAPFPAAMACGDLVFVFGPAGSNRILIESGSSAQGPNLGIQLGPPGPNNFFARSKKVSHIQKIFHTKNIPGRAHLVVFHWFYKGWSHFGPLFGPVLAKYVGRRNEMDAF